MTASPSWLHFFERPYPSANMVLIRGKRPTLVDTGFGSDAALTEQLLRDEGVPTQELTLIVNTHYHGDHVGGNYRLQQRYHIPIAAHRWDAQLVNGRDGEVCGAEWLNQPIEPYRVDRPLSEGDVIDAGDIVLQVLHTPGHTLGHISLYEPNERVLICGDAFHRDDVAWIGVFREGVGALQRMMETLERLALLPIHYAFSGHGPAIDHPYASIQAALRRYEKWLADPEKLGWHACKRIFSYALMLSNGMRAHEIAPYLLASPWFHDYARFVFRCEPTDFIDPLVNELLRAKAAAWRDGLLVALTPYTHPTADWLTGPARPSAWPP